MKRDLAVSRTCPGPLRRSGRRLAAAALAASLLPISALVPSFSSVAGAQQPSSDDLRAKAAKLAERREELQMQISEKDEEYNSARVKLTELEALAATTSKDLDTAQAEYAQVQAKLRSDVVKNFVTSSNGAGMAQGSDVNEALLRRTYIEVGSLRSEEISDQMRAASADLDARKQVVEDTTSQIQAEKKKAEQAKKSLESAETELAQQQKQVSADLEKAIKAEEEARRRAAEAAAREAARREAEREAAREAAAQAAANARASSAASSAGRSGGATSSNSGRVSSGSSARPSAAAAASGSSSSSGGGAYVAPPAPKPSYTPPPSPAGGSAVDFALSKQGSPYSWGAEGPNSFDCSGLIVWAFRQAGRGGLPHSSRSLYAMGTKISVSELRPGDLVAYGSPVHHIGIYIGNEQYVHAPHSGDVVKVSSIYRSNGAPRPVRI